jgi:restriction endonuclease S subunit
MDEDVLIALEGSAAGEVFVVPEGLPRFAPSQQVAVVRIHDHSTINPWYLGAFLSTETARMQMRRLTRGEKVQRIPVRDLNTVSVPLAPRSTQTAVGDQYRTFQAAIKVHRQTAQHLEDMCTSASEMNFAP